MIYTPRKTTFSTVLSILKKRPIPMLFGLFFSLIPLLIVIPLFLGFSSLEDDLPKVDYELIEAEGKEISATVTDMEIQYNVTINGVHPTIISYRYSKNGNEVSSKFKVLEKWKIERMDIVDILAIKELDGNSIIMGLTPYNFSPYFLLLFQIPFLLVGLPFLIYAGFQLKKELDLYKYGKVSTGKIISMMPKSGLPVSEIGQGVLVHYQYETKSGKKIIGKSFTTDFSILGDMKTGDAIPIFVSSENE